MSALSGGLCRPGIILVIGLLLSGSLSAPVYDQETTQVAEYEGTGVANGGCFYNFKQYREGDRIITNEPCLNCTCHNRMLMCYLRVCPFTKAIGQNCKVEKRADQCCSVITCPQVPVHLLTSTTNPPDSISTDLGFPDNYGCSVDGKFYADGAQLPVDSQNPCELCYCIRNRTTCVMQECTLRVSGCSPVNLPGVCCPVKYNCDYEEAADTTVAPTPGLIMTTTIAPRLGEARQCTHDDKVYEDGDLIYSTKPCEHCYCFHGAIACMVQDCGTPMQSHGKNCTALPIPDGQCCPTGYECEAESPLTDSQNKLESQLELTTELSVEKDDVLQQAITESTVPAEGSESFPGADNAIPEIHEPHSDAGAASPAHSTESATTLGETSTVQSSLDAANVPSDESQLAVSPDEPHIDQSTELPESDDKIGEPISTAVPDDQKQVTESVMLGEVSTGVVPTAEDSTVVDDGTGEPAKTEKELVKPITLTPSTEVEPTEVVPIAEIAAGPKETAELSPVDMNESAKPEEENAVSEDKPTTSGTLEEKAKADDGERQTDESEQTATTPVTFEQTSAITESATEITEPTTKQEVPIAEASTTAQPLSGEEHLDVTTAHGKATEKSVDEGATENPAVIEDEHPAGTTPQSPVVETRVEDEQVTNVPTTVHDESSPVTKPIDTDATTLEPLLVETPQTPVEAAEKVEDHKDQVTGKPEDYPATDAMYIPAAAVPSATEIAENGDGSANEAATSSILEDGVTSTEAENLGTSEAVTDAPIQETPYKDSEHVQKIPGEVSKQTETNQGTTLPSVSDEKPNVESITGNKIDEQEIPTKGMPIDSSSEETSSSEESSPLLPTSEETELASGETSSEEIGDGEAEVTVSLPAKGPAGVSDMQEHTTEPSTANLPTIGTSIDEEETKDNDNEEGKSDKNGDTTTAASVDDHTVETELQEKEKTSESTFSEEPVTNLHEEEPIGTKGPAELAETTAVSKEEKSTESPAETTDISSPSIEHSEVTGVFHGEDQSTSIPTENWVTGENTAMPVSTEDKSTPEPQEPLKPTEEESTGAPVVKNGQQEEATETSAQSEPVQTTEPSASEVSPTFEGVTVSDVDKISTDAVVASTEAFEHVGKTEAPGEAEPSKKSTELGASSTEQPTESIHVVQEEPVTTESSVKPVEEKPTEETPQTAEESEKEKTEPENEEKPAEGEAVTTTAGLDENKSTSSSVPKDGSTIESLSVQTDETPIGNANDASTTAGPDISTIPVSVDLSESPLTTDHVKDDSITTTASNLPESTDIIANTEKAAEVGGELPEVTGATSAMEEATTTANDLSESTELGETAEKTTVASKIATDLVADAEKTTESSKVSESTDLLEHSEEAVTVASKAPESGEAGTTTEEATEASAAPESGEAGKTTEESTSASKAPESEGAQDAEEPTLASEAPEAEVAKSTEEPTIASEAPESEVSKGTGEPSIMSEAPESEGGQSAERPTIASGAAESEVAKSTEEPTIASEVPESEVAKDIEEPTIASEAPESEVAKDTEEPTIASEAPELEIAKDTEEPTIASEAPESEVAKNTEEPTIASEAPESDVAKDTEEPTIASEAPESEIAKDTEEPTIASEAPESEAAKDTEEPTIASEAPESEIAKATEAPTIASEAPVSEIAQDAEEPTISTEAPESEVAKDTEEPTIASEAPELEVAKDTEKPMIASEAPDSNVAQHTEEPTLASHVPELEVGKTTEEPTIASEAPESDEVAKNTEEPTIASEVPESEVAKNTEEPTIASKAPELEFAQNTEEPTLASQVPESEVGKTTEEPVIASKAPESGEVAKTTEEAILASEAPESEEVAKTTEEAILASEAPESQEVAKTTEETILASEAPESEEVAKTTEETILASEAPESEEDAKTTEEITIVTESPESEVAKTTEEITIASEAPESDVAKTTEEITIPSEAPESGVAKTTEEPTETAATTTPSETAEAGEVAKDTEATTLASASPESGEVATDTEATTTASEAPQSGEVAESTEATASEVPESEEVHEGTAEKTTSEVPVTTGEASELTTKIPVIQPLEASTPEEEPTKNPLAQEEVTTSAVPEHSDSSLPTETPINESNQVPDATISTGVPELESSTATAEQEPIPTVKEPGEESVEDKTETPILPEEEAPKVTNVPEESATEASEVASEEPVTKSQDVSTSSESTSKSPVEEITEQEATEAPIVSAIDAIEDQKPFEHETLTPTIPSTEISTEKVAESHPITEATAQPEESSTEVQPTEAQRESEEPVKDQRPTEASPVPEQTPTQMTTSEGEQKIKTPFEVYGPSAGIPGEGNCLVDGESYANNSNVPPSNVCQLACRCASSIVQCDLVKCAPPPDYLANCMPVYNGASGDSCCPVYSCASMPTIDNLEAVNQMKPGDREQPTVTLPSEVSASEGVDEAVPTTSEEYQGTNAGEFTETTSHAGLPVSESEQSTFSPAVAVEQTSASLPTMSETSLSTEESIMPATSTEQTLHEKETPTKADNEQKEEPSPSTDGSVASTETSAPSEKSSPTSSPAAVTEASTEHLEEITKSAAESEQPTESSDEPLKNEEQPFIVPTESTEVVADMEKIPGTVSDGSTTTETGQAESSTENASSPEQPEAVTEESAAPVHSETTEKIDQHEETSTVVPSMSTVEEKQETTAAPIVHEAEQPQEPTTLAEEQTSAPITETPSLIDQDHSTVASAALETTAIPIEATSLSEKMPISENEKPEVTSSISPSETESQQTEEPIAVSPSDETTPESVSTHLPEQESSTSFEQAPTATDASPLETPKPSFPDATSATKEKEQDEETLKATTEPTDRDVTAKPEMQSPNGTEVPVEDNTKVNGISTIEEELEKTTMGGEKTPVETSSSVAPTLQSTMEEQGPLTSESATTMPEPIETVEHDQQTERTEDTSSPAPIADQTTIGASPAIPETSEPGDHPADVTTTGPVEAETAEPAVSVSEPEATVHQGSTKIEPTVMPVHEEPVSEEEASTLAAPSDVAHQAEVTATPAVIRESETSQAAEEEAVSSSPSSTETTEEERTTATPSLLPDEESPETTERPSDISPGQAATDADATIKDSDVPQMSTGAPEEVSSAVTTPLSTLEHHTSTEHPKVPTDDEVQQPIEEEHPSSPASESTEPAEKDDQQPSVHVRLPETPIVMPDDEETEVQKPVAPEEETTMNDTAIETGPTAEAEGEYPEHPVENEDNPHFPVNSGSYLNPDEDYDEDDQAIYGPGTCRYGGKVYVSAQQIPRDDPCDFCFCFRSDIICLQQSCPPPIPGCHEEPIRGFCCPRYECHVSMATTLNLTTTTTTTTTTLPPHFLSHAYKGATRQSGCQIRGQAYSVGQPIKSASGPCLQCSCGGDGNMKCDPRVCSPEPTLRQMIAAATARRRR